MASRKDQKEIARDTRLAAEQAASARATQRRRLQVIGGVVLAAAIVGVVAIVISTSGSKTVGIKVGPAERAVYSSVARELKGIPQSGTTLGSPTAPVTIQYFGDLECPICQDLTLGADGGGLPLLIAGPVRSGQVKLQYRSLETASFHVNNDRFIPQQVAAYAAGTQDLFWDYAELFYHEQGDEDTHYVTESYLQGLAKQVLTLNFAKWMTDRHDASLSSQVSTDEKAATADTIDATPALVAIGPKGEEGVPATTGIPTYPELTAAIKTVA